MRAHVILFAKQPRLGRVKSRLAKDIGDAKSLSFYRNNLTRVVRRLKGDPRINLTIAISPDRVASENPAWAFGVPLIRQGHGELGERMARAFRNAPPGPVIIIGSDIPAITKPLVLNAIRKLGHADAVFGPSGDGGYWLVGLRRLRPPSYSLFRSVRWSGPYALKDSKATLTKASVVVLATCLDDVDDGASYHRWKAGNRHD